ncbi:unnamed protein product (macronuclear) [Paramecium tetraurelia]|uniref:Endoplasmic reticulum transmembrane protein n=1 Tax=Paramecium tetraurelia TaxID=5888 RepID=A0BHF9_PARTE|nr:uncharacterized protein GSPATT00029011001 [Paramecium tetraurelia]CAK57976.1 unnamed protein product [Paramecium tetraurelia]|eukprot:XP_001425374.1 hypothetical protein (macronuclear) [Paramecium tetraurelia strain d4-2]
MTFQFDLMYKTMYVGVGLAFIVFFPLPRIIRKPLVRGLEKIFNNSIFSKVLYSILSWTLFLFVSAVSENLDLGKELVGQKAQRDSYASGTSQYELEKTVNQTRMKMFYSQRNIYLTLFNLIIFGAIFTYLKSLVKYDEQLDKEDKLKKQINVPKGAVGNVKQ